MNLWVVSRYMLAFDSRWKKKYNCKNLSKLKKKEFVTLHKCIYLASFGIMWINKAHLFEMKSNFNVLLNK